MLTIQEIKKAKAGDNPRKLYDRDGLYLVVTPAGFDVFFGCFFLTHRCSPLSLDKPGLRH